MTRTSVRAEALPHWERISRSLHRHVDIGGRALGYRSQFFAGGGISGVEEQAFGRSAPCTINEVAELAIVTVQPGQRLLRIFGCRAILHSDELFSYAHWVWF